MRAAPPSSIGRRTLAGSGLQPLDHHLRNCIWLLERSKVTAFLYYCETGAANPSCDLSREFRWSCLVVVPDYHQSGA
jgi:hypothetical protein